jgi:hypothetical protein
MEAWPRAPQIKETGFETDIRPTKTNENRTG